MPNVQIDRLLDAAVFAALQHQYQGRNGYPKLPYINHLLKVAQALAHAGEADEALLLAAVLHDIVEDTEVDGPELAQRFGQEVADIVLELTDDMQLPLAERKQLQVDGAAQLSPKAQKIRLADKAANILDIFSYPLDWTRSKKEAYLHNALAVAARIKGRNAKLDAWFEETTAWAATQLAQYPATSSILLQEPSKLGELLAQVERLTREALEREHAYTEQLARVHPKLQASARNLIHYRSLRSQDISELQKELGFMGLSRLAKAGGHVLASLTVTATLLRAFMDGKFGESPYTAPLNIAEAHGAMREHTRDLLGPRSPGRRTRIMLTLPAEAATDEQLVHRMLAQGMNCARINCAHDGPEAWARMIAHVRKASEALGLPCRIAMDLAGPKIRTGELKPGPRVRRYKPVKDQLGHVVSPAELWIGPLPHPTLPLLHLSVSAEELLLVKPGDRLHCRDTRDKKRKFVITEARPDGCRAHVYQTTYLQEGSLLYTDKRFKSPPLSVGALPAAEAPISLALGDVLRIHRSLELGEPAQYDQEGQLEQVAHVSCTSEDIFEQAKQGDPILFDDGQIAGRIVHADTTELRVEITRTKVGGSLLRADKGINLPESHLHIRGLTAKDKRDLPFVAAHADLVNLSFVNSAADVRDLIDELEALGALDRLGIILKIETRAGFDQLLDILLEAMRVYPLGLMIARGDLAIEVGWENIGRVQEEILGLCQAAHLPDIWATQVLENLAKKGLPSRAEITDAVMAQRAECVMLNKGDYILQALELLDSILRSMSSYQEKNANMLPAMEQAAQRLG